MRHSVAGNPYADTRIGAFMGKRIVNDLRARTGRAPLDYLTELSVAEFESQFASKIPERIVVVPDLPVTGRGKLDRAAAASLAGRPGVG